MKNTTYLKGIFILLVLSLIVGGSPNTLPYGTLVEAQAAPSNLNLVTGLFRSISALNQRNRVYGEARSTSQEINAYYDAQIAAAEKLRQEKISQVAAGQASPGSIRAYIRVAAALERERQAALAMIEAEKNDARRKFNHTLANEIKRGLLNSPGMQSIIKDIRETISNTRQAAAALQAAANSGKPSNLLEQALTEKVGDIQEVRNFAQQLGSKAGDKIDRALGGLITKVEGALTNVQNEMGEAINLLDNLDATIAQTQSQAVTPISLVGNERIRDLIPLDPANARVDAVATAFGIAAQNTGAIGPGETREAMIDRIRTALLAESLTDIMSSLLGVEKGEIFCVAVSRAEYEEASWKLGSSPQQPNNPDQARYLVCYDTQTREPRIARLLESKTSADAEQEEEEAGTGEDQGLAACVISSDNYSWGYENIVRQDCLDPARCTGCGGRFVFQNDTDEQIVYYYYFYSDHGSPATDTWLEGGMIYKPGGRFEKDVSINNRWKQGVTYKSNVVKILVMKYLPECFGPSNAFRDKYATPIDPLPYD